MRYVLVTSVDIPSIDAEGNPTTIPAGSVVNVILWNDDCPYVPGENLWLLQSDTLQIGDVTP